MKVPFVGRCLLGVLSAAALASTAIVAPAGATAKPSAKSLGTVIIGDGLPLQADAYPLYYGLATGIFAKYGVNVQTIDLTPSAGVGALYSGSINLLFDGTGTLNEAVETHQVKAIATYSEVPVWLVALPSAGLSPINNVSQLKELDGKIIGASTPGSLVTDVEQSVVHSAHATPSFDFLGASSSIVAVEHGLVTVTGATPATLPLAQAAGLVNLGSLNKLSGGRGLHTLVGANDQFVKKHEKLLKAFNKAYHASLKAANSNEPELIKVLESNLDLNSSQAAESYRLQKKYEFFTPVSLTEIRYDLNNITSVLPAAAKAKYSQVVDNSALFG